nr:glycosyltransferase family 4 protein [candidate division Zixibacteria bacterium]
MKSWKGLPLADHKKNILLIAYHFPPLGLGGVGRPLGLFRYLPEFGYDVTVLTVRDILYPEYDHTLLDDSKTEKIIRTGSLDPSRLLYRLGFQRMPKGWGGSSRASLCYYPDAKRGWLPFAYRKAMEIIKAGEFKAVITTSPPPSAHLIGLKLKKNLGIKWIADFRDLWFSLPIEILYRTSFQRKYAQFLKRRFVENANEIVGVNRCIVDYLERGEVITNGADPDYVKCWHATATKKETRLVIGVLGTLSDLCPIEPLFKAVAGLIDRDGSYRDRVTIIHVGRYDAMEITDLIDRHGLRGIVCLKGYLPKGEAIRSLATADILYFTVRGFDSYTILPGRIFDYLSSGKPIIGTVPPESDAALLISSYSQGKAVSPDDIDGVADFIELYSGKKETGSLIPDDRETGCDTYSVMETARKYAALLDRLT